MALDYRHAARTLVGELVTAKEIEVRRPEAVSRELALWCEQLGRPPTGKELETWFEDQAGVTEVFATPTLLDACAARLLTPPPPAPEPEPEIAILATDARHPELERGIHDALDSADQYLVYADWLQEQGDPFGELVALGVAATSSHTPEARRRFEHYLALHQDRILGPNARELNECFRLAWRYGFVHAVTCSYREERPTHRIWEELLALRACELVRSVTLPHAITAAVDGVIDIATPHLDTLVLMQCEELPKRLVRRDLRSLELQYGHARLRPSMLSPALHRLSLGGCQVECSELEQLDVHELEVYVNSSTQALFASVQLPQLERLRLAGVDAQVAAMLEPAMMPRLVHLTLQGVVNGDALRALSKLPLASQLRSLTIAELVLVDSDLVGLAAHPGHLTALAELDVSNNELTAAGLAAAARLAPTVISTCQRPVGSQARERFIEFAGDRLDVAEALLDSPNWIVAGIDRTVRWARYRGSSAEYELCVAADLEGYSCTCPSHHYPCKHVVALALRGDRGDLTEASSDGIADRALM
ncbi:MAG: TIGR02996 domain-containing protein [Kofleriaceae bacterium]